MMNKISLFIILVFSVVSQVSNAASGSCLNISGKYSSPFDEQTGGKTLIMINQTGCTSLDIVGNWTSDQPPYAKSYGLVTFTFGAAQPSQIACLNAVPDMCASYSLNGAFITMTTDPQSPRVIADSAHGTCFYTKAQLSKDETGNLVETPFADNCDDGYKGAISSTYVYPKAN
jgi:hypothetical protein